MPDNSETTLAAVIGELRSDNRRNTESVALVIAEVRRLAEKIDQIGTIGIELKSYRDLLHSRFDRINEIAAGTTLALDKLEDRVDLLDNTKFITLDRRIDRIETTWKSQLKIIAVVGSVLLSVGGWVVGTYGQTIIKAFTG